MKTYLFSGFIDALRSEWRLTKIRRKFRDSVIHNGTVVDDDSVLEAHTVLFSNVKLLNSRIGRYSYVQENTRLFNVSIGPFCSIAPNVNIGLLSHPTHMTSTSPVFYDNTQPLTEFLIDHAVAPAVLPTTNVCADVWIGDGARVMSGLTIGVGAVIGAGAVVTRDVKPYEIVGGIPAKVMRKRFEEATCKALLESKWWEMDDEQLRRLAPDFSNPARLVEELDKCRQKTVR